MPFIHNRNKHGRTYFSISIEQSKRADKFMATIGRKPNSHCHYYPGEKSINRIQQLLDSSLFKAEVIIEVDWQARDKSKSICDYINIKIV